MYIPKGFLKLVLLFATAFLLLPENNLFSQTRISSPYSMHGIGELYFNNNFRNMGMGGISIGHRSNRSVNYVNPASYTAVDSTSFVFETTIFSHLYEQKSYDQEQMTNYASLGNIAFKFPVYSWWSSAFGLMPFSAVGYKVTNTQSTDDMEELIFSYEGVGGIHQVFWGNAFNLGKGFSVGVNTSYLFGNYKDITVVSSPEASFYRATQHRTISANGFMLNTGIQYNREISPERHYTIGAIFGNETKLNADETFMYRMTLPGHTVPDTVQYYVNDDGKMNIPLYWGAGFSVKFNENWMAGADFYNQNWNNFELFNKETKLNNSYQVALGSMYTPDQTTYSNFLTRARYTAGVRYKQTYIIHNDNPVNELGISAGFDFRLRRTYSGMTFAFEWVNRGSLENNNLREDIFKFNIGINFHERWFVRRKFL